MAGILTCALLPIAPKLARAEDQLPIKRLQVYQIDAPPSLDGKMDDACWKEATPTGDFEAYQKGGPAKFRTRAWLCYDVENLHVYFQCFDPEMKTVVGRRPQDKVDEDIWQDEEVELFFDVTNQRKDYFQLMCSVLGTKCDMSSVVGTRWHGDRREPGKGWKAANFRDDQAWYLEIAIPFTILRHKEELAATPQPGDVWPANFYRHVCRTGEFINWNVATLGFHQPSRFGELEFMGLRGAPRPKVSVDPGELSFGSNTVRCRVDNTTQQQTSVTATVQLAAEGAPMRNIEHETRVNPGEAATMEVPYSIQQGGDWNMLVRIASDNKLLLVGRATKRLPLVDDILAGLLRVGKRGNQIIAKSAFPDAAKSGLRAQQSQLAERIRAFSAQMNNKSSISKSQWTTILEGVTSLGEESREFVRQLAYMDADNRQSGAGAKSGFLVTVHDSLEHVYTDTAAGTSPGATVPLTAMRAEGESFQVAVSALWKGVRNARVSVSALVGPDGTPLPEENVSVSLIGYLKSERDPNGPADAREWFPDTLLPNAARDIPAYTTQPYWVDIIVPRDAPPGVYGGRVTVEAGSERQTIPVELTVRDFALPEVPLLQNDFWISTHGLGWWKYPLTVEKMEEVYRIAQRNRVSAMPSFFIHIYSKLKITRVAEERYEFDFSDFNPYLLAAREHGVTAWNPNLECNQGWASFFCGGYGPVKIHDAESGNVSEFANCWGQPPKTIPLEDIWTKTPLFEQFWKAYVKNLKEIDLLASAWYESVDEPNDVTRMDLLLLIHKQLKQWVPELKLMSWGTYPAHHFARARGLVDAWAPQLGWYWDVKDTMQKDQNENDIAQKIYTCGSQGKNEKGGYTPDGFVRDPNISRRIVPWMCHKWDIKGYLFFAMNPWPQMSEKDRIFEPETQPWPTVRQFSKTPCYDLIIPGPDYTFHESIRLKAFRDGMEDYDYFGILAELTSQLGRHGGHDRLVTKAKSALMVGNDIVTDPWTYTFSSDTLLRRRAAVGDLVEEVAHALRRGL